ncbi:putative cholesterol 24-hydroxylase isoform X2 [Apostichopus japonicus]|uniref:Putative cholesterol 24-hydroxylase isoform X2 n=1 Tax=Stichopus japonicus TaxID=307972 RepID=A0A2G8JJU6_STIJA|nr:putative cholesterol 24-hydroxylase isoform X2 [Apostichopus japonicus]
MDNKFLKPPENYVVFVELFGERFGGITSYLMQLMDTFNDSADRMVKFIAAQADDGKAEVSMLDAIERVTLDVIAKAGFSMEEDLITNKSEFNDAVSFILTAARRNSVDIFLKYSPFKEARDYRARAKEAIHLLRDTAERMIRQRLKDQQEGKKIPKDILSYIIKTAMVDESFQMVEMVDEFVTFFGAEEIETVIGDKQDLLYEDIAKLEYMMLVFKETLRLCPPVIGTARTTPEELLCAGHRIPAGTMVLLPAFVMSRQEQFFKDPLTFDPERFQRNEDR